MNYLPSKKVLSVSIVVFAFVTSIIIIYNKKASQSVNNLANNLVAGEKIEIPSNPDWLSEVESTNALSGKIISSESEMPETTTDTVSRTLISNYLSLKQNGSLSQDSAQTLVNQTQQLINQNGVAIKADTNVKIIPDSGTQTISDYGEQLGTILKNNKPATVKNELQIVSLAIQSKDAAKIKDLDSVIEFYDILSSELSQMSVPQTFVSAHLDMLNGSKAISASLKKLKTVFSDPVASLSAMQLYGQGSAALGGAMAQTKNFIIKSGLSYKQGSGGYYLLYGI